jgi:hypothetical protein
LVIAGQVLEHTIKPWVVAEEVQRVLKKGGMAQIEVPMSFHWHSMPYDFFRFTFTGLRSLFRKSALEDFHVPEGAGSLLAVNINAYFVNLTSVKILRRTSMLLCRFLFWWLKYTDIFFPKRSVLEWLNPKGICMTFRVDGKNRSDKELLQEFYSLKTLA